MLIPTSRLLLWTALTALPAALLAACAPGARGLAWGLPAALAAVALTDALRSRRLLAGIEAALPRETSLFCDQQGAVEVRLAFPGEARGRLLRLALGLDEALGSRQESLAMRLPDVGHVCSVNWSCLPLRRARCREALCAFESASPAGLWLAVARQPLSGELRVYPNLRAQRRQLAALLARQREQGGQLQRQGGKGREFEKLREYVPGDDIGDIHWKATARRGLPITKLYQIERTQEVYVAIDTSRLTARPAPSRGAGAPRTLLDRFIDCALVLALAAQAQGDRFGLLAFDRQVHTFLGARRGRTHFDACRRALYLAQPARVSPDYRELSVFLRTRLPKRALIVIVTCLDDAALAESMEASMRLVARHHLVALTMLKPAGAMPLFSGPDIGDGDEIRARLAGHAVWQRLRATERALRLLGAHTAQIDDAGLAANVIAQYMTIKRRQLL